ncbi:MAG: exo-alpha-sialidase [Rhodospirillales bacterium]|nr:exo-alpha-sialidase [Rhodospirillales bacterium]
MVRLIGARSRRARGVVAVAALLILASPPLIATVHSYDAAPGYQVKDAGAERDLGEVDGRPEAAPIWEDHAIDPRGRAMVHSATLTELPQGGVQAFWYGGSREGARDVGIYTARLLPNERSWTLPREVMTRPRLSEELGRYIKKLGNPVAFLDASGQVWLFFVSVSVGGWSGSAINAMVSQDGGETFGPVKRLVTSPAFNVSTLVRGRPVQMRDGSITLPVYHEFLGKFAELLRLDPDGVVLEKKRLTLGRRHIQPVLVPEDAETANVFLRYAGETDKRIHYVSTDDAGREFTAPRESNLPNPDSAIDAVRVAGHGLLMVYNHSEVARHILALAVSEGDPGHWTRIHDLEHAEAGTGQLFSYPSILRDQAGRTHVVYTHNRTYIKHVMFNDAWLADARRSALSPP